MEDSLNTELNKLQLKARELELKIEVAQQEIKRLSVQLKQTLLLIGREITKGKR